MIRFFSLAISLCLFSNISLASDYPKTRDEKIADEMGSALDSKGFTFRPAKVRNESTVTKDSKNNQYLWEASIEVIDFAPLAISNQQTGTISTNWFSNKNTPDTSSKVTIKILDNVISPEAIEVKYQSRNLVDGSWVENGDNVKEASKLERDIVRKAREIYQKSAEK